MSVILTFWELTAAPFAARKLAETEVIECLVYALPISFLDLGFYYLIPYSTDDPRRTRGA